VNRFRDLQHTLVSTFHSGTLWLLQLLGNAGILVGFVGWLHMPVATWWWIVLNAILIAVLTIAFLVLQGGTLNYYFMLARDAAAVLRPGFQSAARHVLALGLWAVVFLVLWNFLSGLDQYFYTLPGYLRSEFPIWLRRLLSEDSLERALECLVNLLRWVVVPGLLLPFASLSADLGMRGLISFRAWARCLASLSYWITLMVAVLLSVYVGYLLMDWKPNPETSTLTGEKIHFGFRLLFSAILMVFSWLLTCSMLGRLRGGRETAA